MALGKRIIVQGTEMGEGTQEHLPEKFLPHPNLVVTLKLGVCMGTRTMHQI